jgi:predicted protein tyrosine phosphatase
MIVVSSYWELEETLERYKPTHLISLMDNAEAVPSPPYMKANNHLRLYFHDVEWKIPGISPSLEDIEKIIEFALCWTGNHKPILVHCISGVSRSPAAGLILASVCQPNNETNFAMHLKQKAPFCHPNRLMIKLADQALSLGGKLIDAVVNMGEPDDKTSPEPFVLDIS